MNPWEADFLKKILQVGPHSIPFERALGIDLERRQRRAHIRVVQVTSAPAAGSREGSCLPSTGVTPQAEFEVRNIGQRMRALQL